MTTPSDRQPRLRGAMTALVTPFHNGQIAWDRVAELVERQVEAGITWVVPCGTTGESPTLSADEQQRLIATVVECAAGRTRVLAGTGSNDTAQAIRKTRAARSAGADAAMVVAPYYNRPPQEGLFRHFAAIAESVDMPIVLYNVPFRTGVYIENDTVVRLRSECQNVVAIKHATGSVTGVTDLLTRCDITVLSGDDAMTLPLLSLGASGVVSVIGNLVPQWMTRLMTAWTGGDREAATNIHRKIAALADGLGEHGPNPLPIKAAMAIRGRIDEAYRLPLCPVSAESRRDIEGLLKRLELL